MLDQGLEDPHPEQLHHRAAVRGCCIRWWVQGWARLSPWKAGLPHNMAGGFRSDSPKKQNGKLLFSTTWAQNNRSIHSRLLAEQPQG